MADEKFILPSPAFKDEVKKGLEQFSHHLNPHFSTPNGMLLPRHKQPPPMYGPRGATVPPQYMNNPRKRATHSPRQFKQGAGNYRQANPDDRQCNSQRHPSRQTSSDGCINRPLRSSNNGFDKEVIPELLALDWKLWCLGCDVHCRSEEELQLHTANHKPCIVRGCKFVGHPMIMRKHERQAHKDDETCVKVAVGPSTEEIEQWKDERRKRYPTKQNIILRQQAQEARFNRGERIEESKERFPNRQKSAASQDEQRGYVHKREGAPNVRSAKRSKRRKRSKPIAQTIVEKNDDRMPFVGTSALKDYKKTAKTALSMLGEYGPDSEDTSDEEGVRQEIFGSKSSLEENVANETLSPEAEKVLSEGEIVDDEAFGQEIDSKKKEVNITEEIGKASSTSMESGENVETNTEQDCIEDTLKVKCGLSSNPSMKDHQARASMNRGRTVRKPKKSLLNFSNLRRSNQNTMLEKLLDSDIRHERNVLLQCVRYVLVNKFFGIGKPKEQNSSVISVCEDEK